MATQIVPVRLGSLDTQSSRVRPWGRALDMQNVDIEKTNRITRRSGFKRRMDSKLDGPVWLIYPYGGICGRFYELVDGGATIIEASDEEDVTIPDPGDGGGGGIDVSVPKRDPVTVTSVMPPLASFSATTNQSTGNIDLSWTFPSFPGWDAVVITVRTDDYPETILDPLARQVYIGSDTSVSDTGLTATTRYYYSAFVKYPGRGFSTASEATDVTPTWEDAFDTQLASWENDDVTWSGGKVYSSNVGGMQYESAVATIAVQNDWDLYATLGYTTTVTSNDREWVLGLNKTTNPVTGYPKFYASVIYDLSVTSNYYLHLVVDGSSVDSGGVSGSPPSGEELHFYSRDGVAYATFGSLSVSNAIDYDSYTSVVPYLRIVDPDGNRVWFDSISVTQET